MQSKLIPANADFKNVANSIVNSIESWRTDSQAKTEATLSKMVANIEAKRAEKALRMSQKDASELSSADYGYGNKKQQGD